MNYPIPATIRKMSKLFSIVLHLDKDLRILNSSSVAESRMPWLEGEPRLTDVFEVNRPRGVSEYQDIIERDDQLFLLTARDGSFALRGQFITMDWTDEGGLAFCGAPWLFWINSNRTELSLGIRDFSAQDSQLDQLFLMATEKNMVDDLQSLNDELRQAKGDLEVAQAARDAFFAQMSHEMRTPLNGVVSALSLIEQHRLPEESKELLSLIRSSSNNLMNVINNVLDISKIEAADGDVEPEIFNINHLMDSVVAIVGARALEKGLRLHTRIEPGLPDSFLGDAARLRQILLNLVTNAIKFTDTGEVTIHVTDEDDRDGWIRIDVEDSGIGIPDDLREKIFEPFFSKSHGKHSGDAGTGLGLDIARRNVKSMSGEMEFETAPGRGSTFSVLLPLAADEDLRPERKSVEAAEIGSLRGTVLLVDDNEANLMLGTMLLEGFGLNVKGVGSGEEAVAAVQSQCYCAVLMDISMPDMDGFEATRRIRRIPGRENLPILALTAHASSREQRCAAEVGMDGYLIKPIAQSELAKALAEWLPQSPACAPNASIPDPPITINETVLHDLIREIGEKNLALVMETFVKEARKRWRSLASADAAAGVAREAHSLVSSCRSFGLESVADTLSAIESRARDGQMTPEESLAPLGHELDASLKSLAAWTNGLASKPDSNRNK